MNNNQKRKERISKRESDIRIKSAGVPNWNSHSVKIIIEKYGFDKFTFYPERQEIIITTVYGSWRITHDNKVVTLYHNSKETIISNNFRNEYHKQDVFFNLNSCCRYIAEHEKYKINR